MVLGVTLFDVVGVIGFDAVGGVGSPAWLVRAGLGGCGGAVWRHGDGRRLFGVVGNGFLG